MTYKAGDTVIFIEDWWEFKKGNKAIIKSHKNYLPGCGHLFFSNPKMSVDYKDGNWIYGAEKYFKLCKENLTEIELLDNIKENMKES